MEIKPCTQISFTNDETKKLHGEHFGMYGLSTPYVSSKPTKEDLIKDGEDFINDYEQLGKTVAVWRSLLEELKG